MVLTDAKTYAFFVLQSHSHGTTRYLILDSDAQIYWGQSSRPIHVVQRTQPLGIARLPRTHLEVSDLFPPYNPLTMTEFLPSPSQDPSAIFTKRQNILSGERILTQPEAYAQLTMQEIRIAEELGKQPHANVCAYLGVVVDRRLRNRRVTDIVYKRYTCDLFHYVSCGLLRHRSQISHILAAVYAGMRHIHSLGFVHCDLRPENIFLTLGADAGNAQAVIEEVVVGDLDAAVRIGEHVELKAATREWWPEGFEWGDRARTELDEYSFACLGPWLGEWLEKG
ncbi:hypothetical protein BU26DRAFT_563453 [Trematosphaeria pertusa]|uniref:EKC/KEOPS complex subunit BUD32 n=1 Tax=Trematosphaeria pertusa TaxID=390896 RepID=A0A6A6INW8_9PLEO|nr:uncharacterized protein BU26DRAFT_563453 [Trematosphaeria pertusa]KAF2251522.1 hypothetical protein BU26DRAFT_563453 [Trematosphaeria pertusa]